MLDKKEQVEQLAEVRAAWNELTSKIIGAAMEVHSRLGPVGLESIFQRALALELRHQRMCVQEQRRVSLMYRGQPIGEVVFDLVVNDPVVVELKAVDDVIDVHSAQLASYLRHGDYPLGLLPNFRVAHQRHGVHRRINGKSSRFARTASSAGSSRLSAPRP